MKKLVSKIVRLNGMKMITQLICARVKQKNHLTSNDCKHDFMEKLYKDYVHVVCY